MTAEYRFLECLTPGCGNVWKSNVEVKYPQCSKCRKSRFLVIEQGKDREITEMKRLQSTVELLKARVSALEKGSSVKENVPAVSESPTPQVNEVADIESEPSTEDGMRELEDKYLK